MRAALLHEAPGELVIGDATLTDDRTRRGARPQCRLRLVPQRSALHRRVDPPASSRRCYGHEAAGIRRGGRLRRHRVRARRSGGRLPQRVLRRVPTNAAAGRTFLCDRPQVPPGAVPTVHSRVKYDGDTDVYQMSGLGGFGETDARPPQRHHESAQKICRSRSAHCSAVPSSPAWVRRSRPRSVEPGSTVAVVGVGGIGLNVIQGADARRCRADHRRRSQC